MRWKTAQNDREKIDFILDAINLNGKLFNTPKFFLFTDFLYLGTGYASLQEMIENFVEIRTLITGDGVSNEIGSMSLLPRLVIKIFLLH